MGEVVEMSSKNTDKQIDATSAFGQGINATANDASCKSFREEMSKQYEDKSKSDSDSRGRVYADFLTELTNFHHSAALTKEQIQADKVNPCFNSKEHEMLDFTEKHFKPLTNLRPEDSAGAAIGTFDINELRNYPTAKLTDINYKDRLTDKFGLIGAGIGAGVEAAAFTYALPVAGVISYYGSMGVGIVSTIGQGGNFVIGAFAGSAFMVAWGPLTGGLAGAALAQRVAEPYWEMTQGRRVNKLYDQMTPAIPTFNEYKAASGF